MEITRLHCGARDALAGTDRQAAQRLLPDQSVDVRADQEHAERAGE